MTSMRKKRRREAAAAAAVDLRALQRTPSTHINGHVVPARADAVVEALEWLGDAVLGELVGRCLLAQFRAAPLSARVFRSLRLAAVANLNLAHTFDRMGYGAKRSCRKLKDKADVVEAAVGELALRLGARQSQAVAQCEREHLDVLVATALRAHFDAVDERIRRAADASGPLAVAFNPFACLPQELLDEDAASGALTVRETPGLGLEDELESVKPSVADLVDEYSRDDLGSHHAFAEPSAVNGHDGSNAVVVLAAAAMAKIGVDHVLRASSEVFEVFKVYGMAALTERVSLALALPRLGRLGHVTASTLGVTPAELTHARQAMLSVANLARCAVEIGVAAVPSLDDDDVDGDRRRANTLRAFVGYHSAVASASSVGRSGELMNGVCSLLQQLGKPDVDVVALPPREPLRSLVRAVSEAREFMVSSACDALHSPGERPPPVHEPKQTLLVRRCDSDEFDDLFELLAQETERLERQQQQSSTRQNPPRRKKSKPLRQQEASAEVEAAQLATLSRFLHRRFLFCLEEIVVLFAQRKTTECRAQMAAFADDLVPCVDPAAFRKWDVSSSTLTLAMRDSFFRMLLHDLSHFHAVVSTSKTTRDGTRLTQLRLPLHYSWAKLGGKRVTDEAQARS